MKKLSILKISFHDSSAFVKEKLSLFAKNGQTLYFSTCLFCCQAAFIEDFFFPFLHIRFCDEQNENGYAIMKNRYLKSGPER